MHRLWRDLLAILFGTVACFGLLTPSAVAGPEFMIVAGQPIMNVATDPDSGRSVAITGREGPDGFGYRSLDLFASAVDGGGLSSGAPSLIGSGMKPDLLLNSGAFVALATDARRGRQLVAWSAHKPGMGRTPCTEPELPAWPIFPNNPSPPCAHADMEIFVRVLSRSGRAIGPERQVTSIGPPASGKISSAGATVAYDPQADTYLLVFASRVTGEDFRAALFAQRLRSDGTPLGGPRLLTLQPQPLSVMPLTRLVADPRGGYLLAYTWGGEASGRRLYARRLTPAGRLTGATATVSEDGVGSMELAFDRRSRRALVVYTTAAPGAEDGVRARLLSAGGRPLARPVELPYRLGNGPVVVAADPERGGWAYAFVREKPRLVTQIHLQRATSTGQPTGPVRLVSAPDHSAHGPTVTAIPDGTLLVAWGQQQIVCDPSGSCRPGATSVRARRIGP